MNSIAEALKKLTETNEQLYAKVCTVQRVDPENQCCDVVPIDGSAELFDVPFQMNKQQGGNGLWFYPTQNSRVLVVFLNKYNACICNINELDLMKLVIDKLEFSIDKDGLNLQKEDVQFGVNHNGLRLKEGTTEFVASSDGFLFKKDLDTLKSLMSDLLNAIMGITVTSSPSGGPTSIPINSIAFKAIQTRFNHLLK